MCGILGMVGCAADAQQAAQWRESMRHRGPDAAGLHAWNNGVLLHRRLSVLDTTDAANQPFAAHNGSAVVVFNGEIYNFRALRQELEQRGHRFRTQSDTEVLLAGYLEWGTEVVSRLNGMFAFAIHDARDDSLFLARDRMGEKPLFLCELPGGGLIFSSELKGMLATGLVDTAIDPEAIIDYVHLNYVLAPKTPLRAVRQLPPATCGVWSGGRWRTWRYWNLAEHFLADKPARQNDDELLDRLEALLEDATRLRLNSDVPLGAFLSGGLDSATIVGLMRRGTTHRVHTFSIEFDASRYDEGAHSRAAARHLETTHHPLLVDGDVSQALPEFARLMDVPLGDDSALPMYFLAKATREHVTVALTGDGADELFAGYDTYQADWLRRYLRPLRAPARLILDTLSRLTPEAGAKRSRRFRIEQFRRGLSGTEAEAHFRWREVAQHAALSRYGGEELRGAAGSYSPRDPFGECFRELAGAHWLDRALYVDLCTWLRDDILVKVDRTSMAASLECRTPFLDHRVVELAARLPQRLRMRAWRRKVAVRRVAERLLPREIVNRPKSGFNSPTEFWMRGPLRDMAREAFAGGSLEKLGLRWNNGLDRTWERFLAGERRHQYALWGLFMLALWERHVLSAAAEGAAHRRRKAATVLSAA